MVNSQSLLNANDLSEMKPISDSLFFGSIMGGKQSWVMIQ